MISHIPWSEFERLRDEPRSTPVDMIPWSRGHTEQWLIHIDGQPYLTAWIRFDISDGHQEINPLPVFPAKLVPSAKWVIA